MPKGVPNKRYTPEFKKLIIETMQQEGLSYAERERRHPMFYKTSYFSPLGELTLAADETSLVALVMDGQKYEALHIPDAATEERTPVLQKACLWLDAYFAGQDAPRPPLSLYGTDFQKRVWRELLTIPKGKTCTYGCLATALNSSARAVGNAVGHNPISIFIPCHRVLGSDGSLTGYAGGLRRKEMLLELEGALKGHRGIQ